MSKPHQLLAVLSDPKDQQTLSLILAKVGLQAAFASTIREARGILVREGIPVVLCQRQVLDGDFSDLLSATPVKPLTMVVVCSEHCDSTLCLDAIDLGVLDFISYPFRLEEVEWIVRSALLRSRSTAWMGRSFTRGNRHEMETGAGVFRNCGVESHPGATGLRLAQGADDQVIYRYKSGFSEKRYATLG